MSKRPVPGVSRDQRISDEGLVRLDRQLRIGVKISNAVLQQWISRYGDEARELLKKHGYDFNE